ncbi:MAG TPA: hypothetical protein VNO43_14130 [Candidatus Eisenbacteria bacterium]|nr:hypothetical protein [Candidatus Eisenbacteria bacterium]
MEHEASRPEAQSTDFEFGPAGDRGLFFEFDRFPLQNFPLGVHAESNQTRFREISGEFELVRATLADAVHTYRKYAHAKGRRAQRLFREVEEWIFVDDWSWPFSFRNICEVLELDPDYIRTGLKLWRERTRDQSGAIRQNAA